MLQTVGEVIENLQKRMRITLTSNFCELHKDRVSPVQKMIIDSVEVCPVCELEKDTNKLKETEEEKIRVALSRREYNVLQNASILRDVDLFQESFSTYKVVHQEETVNKQRALTALEQYKKGEVFNTLLNGDQGVGKSHLAMSILRNLNESGSKNKSCLFINVDKMLELVRDSFKNKESRYTEHYFVDLMSNVDFLVLDDIGSETGGNDNDKKASNFTLRILTAVADARQGKSTIITTNLLREDLEFMYDKRTVSRLLKDTYLIRFTETDDKRPRNIEF